MQSMPVTFAQASHQILLFSPSLRSKPQTNPAFGFAMGLRAVERGLGGEVHRGEVNASTPPSRGTPSPPEMRVHPAARPRP
jgi:hypothetical protein